MVSLQVRCRHQDNRWTHTFPSKHSDALVPIQIVCSSIHHLVVHRTAGGGNVSRRYAPTAELLTAISSKAYVAVQRHTAEPLLTPHIQIFQAELPSK